MKSTSKKKIIITGAAGFIAGHLFKYLEKDYEVKGIDNLSHPSANPIKRKVKHADVRYQYEIEPYIKWSDIVIHCAAEISVDKSIDNPRATLDTNVWGTWNVLELCKKYKKKMVFASTSEVYGSAQTYNISESHPLDGQSTYAASKIAGDRLCYAYWKTHNVDVTILRSFNTFGPYQANDSYGGVIAKFIKAAKNNKPLVIYGTGEQERDYIYIDDALEGYKIAISVATDGKPINVGFGKTIKIKELAQMIIKQLKSRSPIVYTKPRLGEVQRLCCDNSYAKSLGFEPKITFEKGLTKYIKSLNK